MNIIDISLFDEDEQFLGVRCPLPVPGQIHYMMLWDRPLKGTATWGACDKFKNKIPCPECPMVECVEIIYTRLFKENKNAIDSC